MRLIDADALYENLGFAEECKDCDHQYNSVFCESSTWQVVCDAIYEAPTMGAVPRWIPCEERLPKDLEVVNITWINHRPMIYYADIKDKPFTATAIHYRDKWWWYSPICEDLLAECGESECDEMDAGIEVTAWMPLPKPYDGEREKA